MLLELVSVVVEVVELLEVSGLAAAAGAAGAASWANAGIANALANRAAVSTDRVRFIFLDLLD